MNGAIALGLGDNTDYEIEWDSRVFETLIDELHIKQAELRPIQRIHDVRALVVSVLGFMKEGKGGECYVEDMQIIKEFSERFKYRITIGGQVAEEAIKTGAHIVNDVWGLRADDGLATVAAKYKTPVILMHNRSNPASVEVREKFGNAYVGAEYENLIEDVKRELLNSVELARKAGIAESHIVLDFGIGFGKTREHNLELVNRLDEIRKLGYPILLGTSRKSFIGFTLDLPADQRVEGTAATVAVGITRGADIIRVHDVKEMARVAKMTDAITRKIPS